MIKNRTLPLSERRPFFNHEWTSVTFRTDSEDSVFLDNCRYQTQSPLIPKHGDFLISQEDLRRLYAPDLTIRVEGETIYFGFEYHDPRKPREILGGVPYVSVEDIQEANMQFDSCQLESDQGTFEMRTAPEMIEGTCYIPVLSLMEGAFGARILTFHEGDGPTYWKRKVVVRDTVSITFDPDFKLDSVFATNITNLLNKECGDIYGTYWFEEGNRLLTYRLYVPFHYDPTVPNKAVVYFPGGLSNENLYFDRTNNGLQKYAEDYGFFLIGLAAYGVSTFFGSLIPILQTLDGIDPSADPQNPEDWPEETLAVRHLADLAGIGMLEEIFSKWNIDRKNVFGQGNSAGSNACIYFALRDPSLFNAIVPTGGFVNINFADLSKLRETPVMHVVGTEDQFGITDIKKVYQRLEELKVPLTIKIVGGGDHYFGWTKAVADIFAFMEAHVVREEMQ